MSSARFPPRPNGQDTTKEIMSAVGRMRFPCPAQALWEPVIVQFVVTTRNTWETDMLKGGLLWLIGIPLPIILILFFMGWLS
jgi:hypothetical protein